MALGNGGEQRAVQRPAPALRVEAGGDERRFESVAFAAFGALVTLAAIADRARGEMPAAFQMLGDDAAAAAERADQFAAPRVVLRVVVAFAEQGVVAPADGVGELCEIERPSALRFDDDVPRGGRAVAGQPQREREDGAEARHRALAGAPPSGAPPSGT